MSLTPDIRRVLFILCLQDEDKIYHRWSLRGDHRAKGKVRLLSTKTFRCRVLPLLLRVFSWWHFELSSYLLNLILISFYDSLLGMRVANVYDIDSGKTYLRSLKLSLIGRHRNVNSSFLKKIGDFSREAVVTTLPRWRFCLG